MNFHGYCSIIIYPYMKYVLNIPVIQTAVNQIFSDLQCPAHDVTFSKAIFSKNRLQSQIQKYYLVSNRNTINCIHATTYVSARDFSCGRRALSELPLLIFFRWGLPLEKIDYTKAGIAGSDHPSLRFFVLFSKKVLR